MRKRKEDLTPDRLNHVFAYVDEANRTVNGLVMRGALVRKTLPGRLIFGSIVPARPGSRAQVGLGDGTTDYLHRVVWIMHNGPVPAGLVVDHEDGDRAHNRLRNFRLLTDAQNQMNRFQSRQGAKVPYLGVCLSGSGFNAFESVAGRPIYLGHFQCPKDAARARDRAVFSRHGDVARLNRDLFPELGD